MQCRKHVNFSVCKLFYQNKVKQFNAMCHHILPPHIRYMLQISISKYYLLGASSMNSPQFSPKSPISWKNHWSRWTVINYQQRNQFGMSVHQFYKFKGHWNLVSVSESNSSTIYIQFDFSCNREH